MRIACHDHQILIRSIIRLARLAITIANALVSPGHRATAKDRSGADGHLLAHIPV